MQRRKFVAYPDLYPGSVEIGTTTSDSKVICIVGAIYPVK